METLSIVIMNWRDIRNPMAGGAEVYTHEVAKRWVDWGHDVVLLTSRFEGGGKLDTVDGVTVVRQGGAISVYHRVKRKYLSEYKTKSDVVIDEINTRPFFATRYVDAGRHLFALIHQLAREFWFYETPFPVSVVGRYLLEDHWLREYRDVPTLTVSESTRTDLKALDFENVVVITNGVSITPLSNIPPKEREPTILYVGRLKKAKLPDHALQAYARIKKQIPNARLWIVGDGYLRKRLERRAPKGTTFFGRVPQARKVALIKRAHILLYPGVREGWGLTVIEANALGTPAIGYDVPGLRDSIQHGRTGVLVPSGRVDEMARVAISMLQDNDLRQAMAKAALDWAHQFDWDKTAKSILKWLSA